MTAFSFSGRQRQRALQGVVLLAMLAMLSLALRRPLQDAIGGDPMAFQKSLTNYYNAVFLTANYFDLGFVRRGLGGTIARIFSADAYRGALILHALSAIYLIAAFGVLQHRLLRARQSLTVMLIVAFPILSPQMFAGWGTDIGRTDMLVIGTIAWSCIAMHSGRPLASSALLAFGFLAHETTVIFGIPLLLAIASDQHAAGRVDSRDLLRAAAALVVAVGAIAFVQALRAPSAEEMISAMQHLAPPPADQDYADIRDVAVYMMALGSRGLKTAMCYNITWPGYRVMVVMSLLVMVMNIGVLSLEKHLAWAAVAVLVPVVFMNVIANDSGRWVKFGCANAWMLSVHSQIRSEVLEGSKRFASRALVLFALASMGVSKDAAVNPESGHIYWRLGYAWQAPAEWMTRCDLQWREVVRRGTTSTGPS